MIALRRGASELNHEDYMEGNGCGNVGVSRHVTMVMIYCRYIGGSSQEKDKFGLLRLTCIITLNLVYYA